MRKVQLGATGLMASRTAFGALPIQRLSTEDAAALVRAAAQAGINYFDTARDYTDSEHKLGVALHDLRDRVIIATKSSAQTADRMLVDLSASLDALGVKSIDVYQFHNPPFVPRPGGADGLYDAALRAQGEGRIGHIGITQHSLDRAFEAVESGLYATLQYPFNHLATEREKELVGLCKERGVGFVAMKALSGGLITRAEIPFAFFLGYDHVVPIWGVQRPEELSQLLSLEACPPAIDADMLSRMEEDRRQLVGAFCRSCGYCLPCPVGIPIHNANRMKQLLTRMPAERWLTDEWRAGMARIGDCTQCGLCARRCPYGLRPYETLPAQLAFFEEMWQKRMGDA